MHGVGPKLVIGILWLVWLVVWTVASLWSKPAQWQESPVSRWLHVGPLVLASLLLSLRLFRFGRYVPFLMVRFLPSGPVPGWIGVALATAGMMLGVWARAHIGDNWSGNVTVKEGHALVTTGPYAAIRHPIYTGLLLAVLGTALAIGEWRGIIALALVAVAFVRKLRVEEARMSETFPEYEAYRRRTAALIPFVW
ncbi:MAG TPA: isoprenylcysteine carboxylmethyltransferase family protein [Stellaceae bacterium]|nr:isoprenylcysteine carboxylmethyltransferase family protein [Stellaceae bacterium]